MNQDSSRSKKAITLSLLFGTQLFSYMIRFVLSIVAPTLMKLYHLTPKTMGYILSGWNWTYTAGLPFVGPLVDRVGPWMVMGVGSVVWGLSTIALPLASTAATLIMFRMVFGLGHSMLIPVTASSVSRLFTAKERARAISASFSGSQVGLAIGANVAAYIAYHLGWQSVFYVVGGASLLLTLAWFVLYPDKRVGTPAVSEAVNRNAPQQVSWASLLTHRSTWGIAFGQLGYLYAYFFFVSWLPGYLIIERKMTLLKSGFISALPFWAGLLGTIAGGWLGDYLVKRGISTTVSRKSIIGGGLTSSTVMVIAAAYAAQSWLAVTLLVLSVGSLRLATASVNSTPIDLAPKPMVGALTSIQNFFGNVGGLLAPIVTGYIVSSTGSFVGSLVVAGGMALFGAICYVFLMGNLDGGQTRTFESAAPIRVSPSSAM
jgi:MFS transporter, ACS family, D-galactonate transporter